MGEPMTDSQLLKLLQEKLPVELSDSEIQELRESIRKSPKVRDALVATLSVDQGVATEMAPEAPGLDSLMEMIDRRRGQAASNRLRTFLSILVCGLVCGCLIFLGIHAPTWLADGTTPIVEQQDDNDRSDQNPAAPANDETSDPQGPTIPENDPTEATDPTLPNESTNDPANEADSNEPGSGETVVIAPEDLSPAADWRLYDNRAQQPSSEWREDLHRILLPVGGAILREQAELPGLKLDGTFAVACPSKDGPALRLNLDDIERLNLSFWNEADKGTIVQWHEKSLKLRAMHAHRPTGSADLPQCPGESNDIDQLREAKLERIDPTIDFDWPDGMPIGSEQQGGFTVEWDGFLTFPGKGSWLLYVTTADKVTIELDGHKILDKNASEQVETVETRRWTYGLTPCRFRIIYCGRQSRPSLKMEWERKASSEETEFPREPIPKDAYAYKFIHADNDTPDSSDEDLAEVKSKKFQGLKGIYRDRYHVDLLGEIEEKHSIGDDGKTWRDNWNRGPIDIRYERNAIRISRANIELIALPMKNPPNRCVLDTECNLQNAEWIRLPPLVLNSDFAGLNTTTETIDASSLDWQLHADEPEKNYTIRKNEDGSVELLRIAADGSAELRTSFDFGAGFELTMRVDQLEDKSGIFLNDPAWESSQYRIYFRKFGDRWFLCPNSVSDGEMERSIEAGREISSESVWLRLTCGLNHGRIDFSTDGGDNWREAVARHFDRPRPLYQQIPLGIRFEETDGKCSLRIQDFTVRRFNGIESLAKPGHLAAARTNLMKILNEIRDATAQKNSDGTTGDYWRERLQWPDILDQLYRSRPAMIPETEWRIACNISIFHSCTPREIREPVIHETLMLAVKQRVDWARLGPALKEVNRRALRHYYDYSWNMVDELYDRMGRMLWESHREEEIIHVVDAWYGQHHSIRGSAPAPTLPPGLLRYYFAHLMQTSQWDTLLTSALREQNLAGWGNWEQASHRHPNKPLIEVVKATAIERLGLTACSESDRTNDNPIVAELSFDKLHPVRFTMAPRGSFEPIEKAALHLKDGQFDRAADELLRSELTGASGLTPVDRQWHVSAAIALQRLVGSSPELREAMQKLEGIGQIRLQRGLQQTGDALLESVAVQFNGMSAGYNAQVALANRQLARGEFLDAAVRFTELIEVANPEFRELLRARQRLAYAMTGRLVGKPIRQSIVLGEKSISADRFENIVTRAADARKHKPQIDALTRLRPTSPGADKLRFDHLITWSITKPTATEEDYYPYFDKQSVEADEFFRRPTDLGLVVDRDGTLYRQQEGRFGAYNINQRRNVFDITKPIELSLNPRNLAATPLILADRVVTPFCDGTETALTCFDRATGDILWRTPLADMPVGSAISADDTILCMSIVKANSSLAIHCIEPETGRLLSSKNLASIHQGDLLFQVGRPIIESNRCVFTVGGTVFCTDLQGNMHWARRMDVLPARISRREYLHHMQSDPISLGDRVLATSPSGWHVECMSLDCGERLWQLTHPDLRRMVGEIDNRVILATSGSLIAADTLTGKIVWSQPFAGDPRRVTISEDGEVCYLDIDETTPEKLQIVRYKAADGSALPVVELDIFGASKEPASDVAEEGYDTKSLGKSSRVFTDGRHVFYIRIVGPQDRKKLEIIVLKSS